MKQIKIGALVNTHGLKGEVKVKVLTDFPDIRFQEGNTVYIQYLNTLECVEIERMRTQKDMLLVTFAGYHDINLVEKWKGCPIFIDETQLHELEEDEAYFYELMDCEVSDESGHMIGKVVEVIETGANAVLRVRHQEKDVLIPYVKAFVKTVDKDHKKINVELMDGML